MSNEPKYRPSLTLPQIDALVQLVGEHLDSQASVTGLEDLISAAKVLRVFQFKAQMGVTQPASVPTGGKPGRMSAVDLVMLDHRPEVAPSYSEAVTQAAFYQQLGQPVPTHIQAIINDGAPQS